MRWSSVLAVLVAACGGNGGVPTDAAHPDVGGADAGAPDGGGQGLHVTWSFEKDGVAATCTDVGAAMVRISFQPVPDAPPFDLVACGDAEAVVFPPPDPPFFSISAIDAAGNAFVVLGVALLPGQADASARLEVFDEPRPQLAAIATSARTYHEVNGSFPPFSATTPALFSCCPSASQICPPDLAQWSDSPTWTALGFSVATRSRFHYTFSSSASGFTVRGNADLDCDTLFSKFEIVGTVDAMGVVQLGALVVSDEFE